MCCMNLERIGSTFFPMFARARTEPVEVLGTVAHRQPEYGAETRSVSPRAHDVVYRRNAMHWQHCKFRIRHASLQ